MQSSSVLHFAPKQVGWGNRKRKRTNTAPGFVLYATGLGTSGQLGVSHPATDTNNADNLMNANNFDFDQINTPVGIPSSVFSYEQVKSVDCGWYHSVVVTENGSLYTCGAGYSHQSGHFYTTNIRSFKKLSTKAIKGPVKQVSCGGHHTLVLTELGKVYSFGEGREGQLGTGEKLASSCPCEIIVLELEKDEETGVMVEKSVQFIHVVAGGYHSVLIDDKYRVWSFGKNSYGQLGLHESPHVEEYGLEPALINKVVQQNQVIDARKLQFQSASAGAWHTILLTKDGQCFGMGDTQYGQLGIMKHSDTSIGQLSISTAPIDTHLTSVKSKYFFPEHIEALGQYKIKSVACGYFHTIFIDVYGRAYACGWGAYGQCGNGSNISERLPKQILTLRNIPIHSATCGWNHAVLIDKQGNCYAFGESKHGQLAKENGFKRRQVEIPERVDLVKESIARVACGRGHTLFLAGEIIDDSVPFAFDTDKFTDVIICAQ